jgi:predicted nuclease of predicted toxin-antitoxin system
LKFKLDENLSASTRKLFEWAGHDTSTVASQQLCGTADRDLIQVCRREQRALITLDLDFANPLRFRPFEHFGIAVLRSPLLHAHLPDLCRTVLHAVQNETLAGKLWIVELGASESTKNLNTDRHFVQASRISQEQKNKTAQPKLRLFVTAAIHRGQ